MRSLGFGRYAFNSCVAAAMLAGCGGSQPPIGAPGAIPQSRAISMHTTYGDIDFAHDYRIVHAFLGAPSDGGSPSGLVVDNGILYGTTAEGGGHKEGTVYRNQRGQH